MLRSMNGWVFTYLLGLVLLSPSTALADEISRAQHDALTDGIRRSGDALLSACYPAADFLSCAHDSGMQCEETVVGNTAEYSCKSRVTIVFSVDGTEQSVGIENWYIDYRITRVETKFSLRSVSISSHSTEAR